MGSQADFGNWSAVFWPAILLTLAVILVKPVILYKLFRLRRFTRRNSFLAAITSAQLSEFGFIILFAGVTGGYLEGRELGIFTIAAILTIFISSYLVVYGYRLYEWLLPVFLLFGPDRHVQPEKVKEKFDAFIFGYHRTGWKIGQALMARGLKVAVVDFNPENVARLEEKKLRVFFGDASDVEFLQALPLDKTKLVVSTVPSAEDQIILLNHLRARTGRAVLIASLYEKKHVPALYAAGADYVLLPHLLGGSWMAEMIGSRDFRRRSVWQSLRRQQDRELAAA